MNEEYENNDSDSREQIRSSVQPEANAQMQENAKPELPYAGWEPQLSWEPAESKTEETHIPEPEAKPHYQEPESEAYRSCREPEVYRSYRAPEPPQPKKPKKKIWPVILAVVLIIGFVGGATYGITALTKKIAGLRDQVESLQAEKDSEEDTLAESKEVRRPEESAAHPTLPGKEDPVLPTEPSISSGETVEAQGVLVDVSDIVASALPSVVSIVTKMTVTTTAYPWGDYSYETQGAGSGILIGDNGTELWIVTNYHVIDGASEIKVSFIDDETVDAYVKGSSMENDIAVLGIQLESIPDETEKLIRAINIGDSDELRLGEGVVAIGNALGWGQSVTVGVVSALKREVTFDDDTKMDLLQTSAAINPGNSGGALLNKYGELVGINNAKYSDTDVEGIGFAIPITSVLEIMEELSLMEPRVPVAEDDYPYMGVSFKELSQSYMAAYGIPVGAYVYEVGEGTPAEKAGILPYDIITSLNGAKITSYEDLTAELQYYTGGTEVTLTVQRLERGRYHEETLPMTLGYKKDYQEEK